MVRPGKGGEVWLGIASHCCPLQSAARQGNVKQKKGGAENIRPSNKIKAGTECKIKPSEQELWELSKAAVLVYNAGFCNVYKFINLHKDCPVPALIETLKAVVKYKPREPWAYGTKVLDIESGKFYAEKNIEEHKKIKAEEKQGLKGFKSVLKEILEKI